MATNNTAHQMTEAVLDGAEYVAYREGLAAGLEQMRERAAGVCQARAAVHAAAPRRRQWAGIEIEAARLEALAIADEIGRLA